MVFVKYSRNDEKERMFFMNAFDRIIGYSSIKKDLQQISDTLKNREAYDILGVSAPRGLLLYGKPGVGKSLMARAVIQDSGRRVFCCRKDSPNGDFVKKIKTTFENAVENAPSIVYLDDMDKFANGDELHPDAEEYVTVQSCIDEAKDKQIFVLATVNNMKTSTHVQSPFQVIHMLLIVIFIQSHIQMMVQPFTLVNQVFIFLLNLVHLLNVQRQEVVHLEEDFTFIMQTLQ